jgi:hypothetical protein
MRLERPKRQLLTLALIGTVLAIILGAVNVEMAAVWPPWRGGIPPSVSVSSRSEQAASPIKPRAILCMLKLFRDAPAAPRRRNAEGRRAL